ncbi:unnamed protein product [Heligmosomoides polygyrus]|uniref:START domain-containing protein n=1 Tax=Heligmosomoides polygyrus TaxID=6339 RepID=A0A183FDX6_HELPZ|nr:unnamed protein product [Heligmosomoides polygyrus]
MKFTVEGTEHELPNSLEKEYGDAFKSACDAMSRTLEIIRSPGYVDRTGWKVDSSNEYITVYYKDIDGLRYYAAKTTVAVSAATLVGLHWNDLAGVTVYNDNMKYCRTVRKLTDDVDVAHYATNDKFMVKSREFLCGRMKKSIDDGYVLALRSCSIDSIPPSKESVRAVLHLGAAWYTPDPKHPESSSTYDYLISVDLKGMLLKPVANQALGKFVLSDVENIRVHALKLAAR